MTVENFKNILDNNEDLVLTKSLLHWDFNYVAIYKVADDFATCGSKFKFKIQAHPSIWAVVDEFLTELNNATCWLKQKDNVSKIIGQLAQKHCKNDTVAQMSCLGFATAINSLFNCEKAKV